MLKIFLVILGTIISLGVFFIIYQTAFKFIPLDFFDRKDNFLWFLTFISCTSTFLGNFLFRTLLYSVKKISIDFISFSYILSTIVSLLIISLFYYQIVSENLPDLYANSFFTTTGWIITLYFQMLVFNIASLIISNIAAKEFKNL